MRSSGAKPSCLQVRQRLSGFGRDRCSALSLVNRARREFIRFLLRLHRFAPGDDRSLAGFRQLDAQLESFFASADIASKRSAFLATCRLADHVFNFDLLFHPFGDSRARLVEQRRRRRAAATESRNGAEQQEEGHNCRSDSVSAQDDNGAGWVCQQSVIENRSIRRPYQPSQCNWANPAFHPL
jgi:hypothetical protein